MDKEYIRLVAANIRKNGLPQRMGSFFVKSEGVVVGACALGQAAYNMGYEEDPATILWALNDADVDIFERTCPSSKRFYRCERGEQYKLGYLVAHLNDNHGWTYAKIADYLERIAK